MKKCGTDSKVKKTLVRNSYEHKVKQSQNQVVQDASSSHKLKEKPNSKDTNLAEPSLCSSKALAQYLTDIKTSLPEPTKADLNFDKGQLRASMTKKLNFHFSESIYKNLIELNASVEDIKTKKQKRPGTLKKDLEPNIEDFYQDVKEFDFAPNIPVITPKFKPVKKVENGDLHRLITKFECL